VVFCSQPSPGDLNRRLEAPGPDLQLENSPIEPDPPAHCHTVKNYRGGTAENNYSAGKIFYIQKRTERAHFLFWPARTNMEGVGSGRGTNICACWRLRVRIPLCTCDFFCWLFLLWGASRSARKKASCARPHWQKLRVWGLAAGRLFSPIFFDACFAVYNARRLRGSKIWISATLHRQGPRMVSEARNVCFGITGARNRPIPTLLPSGTCTQTPLDRPRMLFRRDPDFADAPETAQNGGFRHHFATECVFADFSLSTRRPRPKASFAREYWLRNVAGAKYSFAPQGHFFCLETGTYGHATPPVEVFDLGTTGTCMAKTPWAPSSR